jgi:hypothetical protein
MFFVPLSPNITRNSGLEGSREFTVEVRSQGTAILRTWTTHTYGDTRSLYLNPTNRVHRCFLRALSDKGQGAILWGEDEPDLDRLKAAVRIEDRSKIRGLSGAATVSPLSASTSSGSCVLASGAGQDSPNTSRHACLIRP